ncbi:lipoprotein [Mesoplasma seiffertii]|uniref:lipoprotein n=1 Tax=Mesoplasma seiffertii TaxID=28224 RepID=UPI00056BAFEE|nr:lipoprotein [Mesoplasma seiffertii]
MKKLLTILGAVTLMTTAGLSVVACGNKKQQEPEPKPDEGKELINKLIKQFENEVTTKWASTVAAPMGESATLLESEANSNNLSFFEKANLADIYKKAKQENPTSFAASDVPKAVQFYNVLEEKQKDVLKRNVESLLSSALRINDLKKSISASMYQVIIGALGQNWIENISFDYQTALLNFTKVEGESFLANLEVNYSARYSYMDAEDTKQTKTISGAVSITISDEKIIVDTIKKIQQSYTADLLKAGDNSVWIDRSDLNVETAEIVGGRSEKYKVALEQYYKKLAYSMVKNLECNYFANSENNILKAVKVSLNDSEDVVRNNSKVSEIGSLNLQKIKLTKLRGPKKGVIDTEQLNRQKTYFGAVTNTANISLADNTVAKNKILFDDLKVGFEEAQKNFRSTFELEYKEITKNSSVEESANIENLMEASVANEQVVIKGIQFALKNGYTQKLNDIKVSLAVAVDKTATKETEVESSKGFAAYYSGAETALNVFHKFYGITPTDIDELSSDAKIEEKGLLFYMTGKTGALKADGAEFNIWDYWKNLKPDVTFLKRRAHSDVVTRGLNLIADNNPEVAKIKNEYFLSKLKGIESFNFNYIQTAPTGWRNLKSFAVADVNSNITRGLQATGVSVPSGPNYYQTLEMVIANDLFNITLGESGASDEIYFDDGHEVFTMIGMK